MIWGALGGPVPYTFYTMRFFRAGPAFQDTLKLSRNWTVCRQTLKKPLRRGYVSVILLVFKSKTRGSSSSIFPCLSVSDSSRTELRPEASYGNASSCDSWGLFQTRPASFYQVAEPRKSTKGHSNSLIHHCTLRTKECWARESRKPWVGF